MSKKHSKTAKDLLQLFEPYLTTKDLIYCLIQSKIVGLYCKFLKFKLRFKKKNTEPAEIDKPIICPLRGIPCIHTDPDGLDNCFQCEYYNTFDYTNWLETGKTQKLNSEDKIK